MDDEGPIVIRKGGGFLSAIAYSIFGTLSVAILCGSALAFYGIYVVDRQVTNIVEASPEFVAKLAAWQDALPPALYDAIHDERALDYAAQVDVQVQLSRRDGDDRMVWPVVEVTNLGDETISLMGLRIVVEDAAGVPVQESSTFAATPVAADGDWRGPLLPGASRRMAARPIWPHEHPASAAVEITELRVCSRENLLEPAAPLEPLFNLDDAGGIPLELPGAVDPGAELAVEAAEADLPTSHEHVPHEHVLHEHVPHEDTPHNHGHNDAPAEAVAEPAATFDEAATGHDHAVAEPETPPEDGHDATDGNGEPQPE